MGTPGRASLRVGEVLPEKVSGSGFVALQRVNALSSIFPESRPSAASMCPCALGHLEGRDQKSEGR